ncbi:MAG: hypothetical protein LBD59_02320 [Prevotellaceae bacterium]|jgi:hypothetical protein|nr:hypothetical protein [Prevotellaceae bacterium]
MEYLYRKKIMIMIMILILLCITSCNPSIQDENVYEILIRGRYNKIGDKFVRGGDIRVDLIAIESERDSVLQQHYPGDWTLAEDILNKGLDNRKESLLMVTKEDCFYSVLKKDFNHLSYIGGYEIDLTKGQNTIFPSNFFEKDYSWTIDSIPLSTLTHRSVILVEPDYELYINDSIYIPHASKLISIISIHNGYAKYTFVYDRKRQIIVSAVLRNGHTNEIICKHELIKVIKLTRDEFYSFWREPDLVVPDNDSDSVIWDNSQYVVYPM